MIHRFHYSEHRIIDIVSN